MAAAHAAGLAHLCLNPDCLRWTPGGGVKITGLGIDAALADATAEDPAVADTYRLGMLLYAALTGHWPGPDWPALPPAPLADGLPCSPRQVRAGVPAALDEITSRGHAAARPGRRLPADHARAAGRRAAGGHPAGPDPAAAAAAAVAGQRPPARARGRPGRPSTGPRANRSPSTGRRTGRERPPPRGRGRGPRAAGVEPSAVRVGIIAVLVVGRRGRTRGGCLSLAARPAPAPSAVTHPPRPRGPARPWSRSRRSARRLRGQSRPGRTRRSTATRGPPGRHTSTSAARCSAGCSRGPG